MRGAARWSPEPRRFSPHHPPPILPLLRWPWFQREEFSVCGLVLAPRMSDKRAQEEGPWREKEREKVELRAGEWEGTDPVTLRYFWGHVECSIASVPHVPVQIKIRYRGVASAFSHDYLSRVTASRCLRPPHSKVNKPTSVCQQHCFFHLRLKRVEHLCPRSHALPLFFPLQPAIFESPIASPFTIFSHTTLNQGRPYRSPQCLPVAQLVFADAARPQLRYVD